MASSTTTRKPANGDRERMDGDYAQQELENRATVDDPTAPTATRTSCWARP